jgi:peptidoglycan/xylan/chitin deacetylase (PgdA/CDA1 family)
MNKIIFKFIRLSGLPYLSRQIIQRNRVTILLFHNINEEEAEMTFGCLSKRYNFIALSDFIEAVKNNHMGQLPKRGLIITFDDGYIGNYQLLPIIKKYSVPATIFLCSSIIDTNRHFWWTFTDKTPVLMKLTRISNEERLNMLSQSGFSQDMEFDSPQALQKSHIDEMKSHVDLQSHTKYHPTLLRCNDDEARKEIFGSKETLEKDYGLNIYAIAYPNGDYSERDILFAKEAGYTCGITVDFGFNNRATDPFRLKRLSVDDTDDINELIVKASGVWTFFKTLNKRKQT